MEGGAEGYARCVWVGGAALRFEAESRAALILSARAMYSFALVRMMALVFSFLLSILA